MAKSSKHIVITGASSGIGAALAEEYADDGVTLGLMGRDEARLHVVKAACEAKGTAVELGIVEVTDAAGMAEWLRGFDENHPVDVLIANAGISGGTGGGGEAADQVRRIFAVNVDGVLNTVLPLKERMEARGAGQVAIMSSLAGMRGLPTAPAYSASKAAVKHYGEALRGEMGKHGVGVSVICPGYIKTPLTDANGFYMPFLMDAKKAAKRMRKGIDKNRSRIAFPLRLYIPLWLLSCLSPVITDKFFAALPSKQTVDL